MQQHLYGFKLALEVSYYLYLNFSAILNAGLSVYTYYASETRSFNLLIFTLKICHLLCTHLSFEIIRVRMKTTVEGDEHLDF